MEENDRRQEKAQQREEWARRGIIGKCTDCGRLVARSQAKQQKWPLGPGWDEIHYFCPDCISDYGFSETGGLVGLDGESISETIATGRDFV
jgi:hypothetical protein